MSSPNLSTWQVCTGSGFEREITPLNFKEGSIELYPLLVLEGLSGLPVQMRFVSPDLTGDTNRLHFYPRLHSSISKFLSPVLLMRRKNPGASAAPNPVTEKGRRWISSAAPLTYPRSTQDYLCLPVSHFAPYCRIMSLQDGILKLSESRCADVSCLILWPYAGGKTEGQRNNPWV